jgi:hypothetical protein
MFLKLSNKTYYQNHLKVVDRYTTGDNYIHIIGNDNPHLAESKNVIKVTPNRRLNEQIDHTKKYKTIIFTDFFEASTDIYSLLKECKLMLEPQGKLVISVLNYKLSFIVKFFEFLGLKQKSPKLSHINENHLKNLSQTTGLEYVNSHTKQIIPFKLFGILYLVNFVFEIILSKFNFGLLRYIVLTNSNNKSIVKSKKTVLIPAKNEEGNIEPLFKELDNLNIDEIIFSIGKSKDKTFEKIQECSNRYKNLNVVCHNQTKNGKANAIWESLELVTGDVVAILDSDLSVDPKELENFYSIIENNYADFVNGTRLIYPMEKESMRKLNLFGNRVFQYIVSVIIGIKLSDSLCGTKVFRKDFIEKISWWQKRYKLFDPFCDFDLIFTAAITGEKIVEYPIHYKSRIYGKTQISRFRDGFKLIIYLVKSYRIFHTS